MVEIRPLHLSELDDLRTVAFESFNKTFGEFNTPENMEHYYQTYLAPDVLLQDFHEPAALCYMAWSENQPAGFVRLRRNPEVDHFLGSNTIEIQRLYIHPLHQGKKIGSQLMQLALDYALSQGFDWAWLGVWEYNFKAQEFYAKWGFERFSQHIFQMGDDPQTDFLLKRKL
jgi:ribosomal protein S18 acetylase RimI-like enzyme